MKQSADLQRNTGIHGFFVELYSFSTYFFPFINNVSYKEN